VKPSANAKTPLYLVVVGLTHFYPSRFLHPHFPKPR